MKLIDIQTLRAIIGRVGLRAFNGEVLSALEQDFRRWEAFTKSPRHAIHYPHGVIELMPCSDGHYYSFKYVNGHPQNPGKGRLSVVALGVLAEVASGYPLMLSEMTVLTAMRTSATAALGAKYLARKDASHLAILGTGAQAEFQVHALREIIPLEQISYYDPDARAMRKFASNLKGEGLRLSPCATVSLAVESADLIVTATAAKRQMRLFRPEEIRIGVHIHAMGGDCPGKTELDPELLARSKVVVEYLPQFREEGEIQNVPGARIHAELWEIVSGRKPGRESDDEITL
ncbi:MAG TPA: ornithine cyclodeaminase, partial [Chromatiales bacterium]|nr:ornithine cyclodeaminase [Chromatiales bacterium]